jgi:hypothetical protein
MIIAVVAFIPNEKGISIATPATGPMPGSTPISVPARTPRKQYARLTGCRAMEKPDRRAEIISTVAPS